MSTMSDNSLRFPSCNRVAEAGSLGVVPAFCGRKIAIRTFA
jgi:hypothetical protein